MERISPPPLTVRTQANGYSSEQKQSRLLLKEQLQIQKYMDDGGAVRYTIKPVVGELTFDKGFYMFVRAIQLLSEKISGVIMVGLAGPSGSGKTAFSAKIKDFLPGVTVLSLDNYNDASRLIDGNFDDPRLTDWDLLLENIRDLRAGKPAEVPHYDFKQSKRTGYTKVPVPRSRVVIVEGIYALSARLRPQLDLRVSIQGGVHFDLVKRVLRDVNRSAQQPDEIIDQISATVYPMYKTFIEPDLKTAHLRIFNSFNPFSGLMNATYILKSAHPVTKQLIKAVLKPDHTSKTETETHDIYLTPPGEDVETCQSWIRMRNRDGRYNLMFEEWVTDGPFIISPRITFEVSVRILGGLMALGYEIGTIMKRTSTVYRDDNLTIKLDDIEGMGRQFVQVQGKVREQVAEAGKALGLEGHYIPRSYIEQVQLERLTAQFQTVTEDMRRRFAVDGEPLVSAGHVSASSPLAVSPSPLRASSAVFRKQTGFSPAYRSVAASAPTAPMFLPPPRPISVSSGESSLTRELSRQDLSLAGSNHSSGNGNGCGNGGRQGSSNLGPNLGPTPGSQSGVQPGFDPGVDHHVIAKVDRALQNISSRVDELALQPQVYTARLEQELSALAASHKALQDQLAAQVTASPAAASFPAAASLTTLGAVAAAAALGAAAAAAVVFRTTR
mmetsp:Transcript_11150/g.33431  ORF Transcript_11150/g.33431 Transcript_11150/m.33431 type:complete len:669 (+) Transcript_11150:244-2250(+)|eukprot:CAMPEP_0206143774 /NCGR_PEP_ID=MMETSP1473-20131121/21755_1 /ASSEMBLY_ACC=CAM_ASM_001109 /TAXON_ID=1461547 /ORGANISM="Stichococcus sp, Strain RCC1054" /LENGTH=668 /DNA_ID=CAMNT_0053539331 /DNA_START=137 /DNA_END=2143 /DNA_ORIENTATION=-